MKNAPNLELTTPNSGQRFRHLQGFPATLTHVFCKNILKKRNLTTNHTTNIVHNDGSVAGCRRAGGKVARCGAGTLWRLW